MKVYLSGPMRGLPDHNFYAFDLAQENWEKKGHQVFSPASISRAMGYTPDVAVDKDHIRHVMLSDIACIYHCDAIAMLPGWEKSKGSTVELAMAQFLELKVYDAITQEILSPIHTPWSR